MNQDNRGTPSSAETLLESAIYLAEKIASSDARGAAMENIIPHVIETGDVDRAAELADSVDDAYVRDRMLAAVVSKCAAIDDDDYALQLIDAIDEHSSRNTAREQMALQKAKKGEFEKAFAAAEGLDHTAEVLAGIAVFQAEKGFAAEANKTLERIDFNNAKVDALQTIAVHHLREKNVIMAGETLEKAALIADEVEFTEDKIRAFLGVAGLFNEANLRDRAIEMYAKASDFVEGLDGVHKDNLFVAAALGFMRSGSIDLADRTLDLVTDKTQISDCLIGFSQIFRLEKDFEESLEALDEAYAIIKSQTEKEIRSTQARNQLIGTIATEFAELGKFERAIEIAQENPDEQQKNAALIRIVQISTAKNELEVERLTMKAINEVPETIAALTVTAETKIALDDKAGGAEKLNEARSLLDSIPLPLKRFEVLGELASLYEKGGNRDDARETLSEALRTVVDIRGNENRSMALFYLAQAFGETGNSLSTEDFETLKQIAPDAKLNLLATNIPADEV